MRLKTIYSETIILIGFIICMTSCDAGSSPRKKRKIEKEKNTHEVIISGKNNLKALLYLTPQEKNGKVEKWKIQFSVDADSIEERQYSFYTKEVPKGVTKFLRQLMKIPYEKAVSANFTFEKDHFELVEAIPGSEIDTAALSVILSKATVEKRMVLDLIKDSMYVSPKFDIGCKELEEGKEALDKCLKGKVTLMSGTNSFELKPKIFGPWLHLDSVMNITFDPLLFQEYMQKVAAKVEEPIAEFMARYPDIDTGDFSLDIQFPRIQIHQEMGNIFKLITKGKNTKYELVFTNIKLPQGIILGHHDFVEISLLDQKLWLYRNGNLLLQTDVVTGNKRLGRHTPTGHFRVKYKERNRVLRGDDYEAFVSYWMPFYQGYGLHDADWRRTFGGKIYERSGSHGCVNMPPRITPLVYDNVKVGMPVILY